MSSEDKYGTFVCAVYAVIFLLIGYGIFTTPTVTTPPSVCLSRPWLDTANGC